MENEDNIKPFDSFVLVYKVLTFAGFAKLKQKPRYKILSYLFTMYRFIGCGWSILYCIQLFAYLPQVSDNENKMVECLLLAAPITNQVFKMLNFIWYHNRLQNLNELMDSPIFAANNESDRKLLRKNRDFARKLTKLVIYAACVIGGFWVATTFLSRMNDSTHTPPIYVPFRTDTYSGFLLAAFFNHAHVIWIGFGHLAIDMVTVFYYTQAATQIKILRENLEHFADSVLIPGSGNDGTYRYIDDLDDHINNRFRNLVERHLKVLWFAKEVNMIFYIPISLQLFSTSLMLCINIYILSKGVTEFGHLLFYIGYFLIIQTQAFLFCFCGELVNYESQFVVESVYLSQWYNLSPTFRRQLLIGMTMWTSPISFKVAGVVPLSLTSYFAIVRLALNLFAVLNAVNNNDANKQRSLSF